MGARREWPERKRRHGGASNVLARLAAGRVRRTPSLDKVLVGTGEPVPFDAPTGGQFRGVVTASGRRRWLRKGDRVIRVLVAEDVRISARDARTVLGLEADIEVVAEVATGDRIVAAAFEYRPDVAVLDIDVPGMDGLTAAAGRSTAIGRAEAVRRTAPAARRQASLLASHRRLATRRAGSGPRAARESCRPAQRYRDAAGETILT